MNVEKMNIYIYPVAIDGLTFLTLFLMHVYMEFSQSAKEEKENVMIALKFIYIAFANYHAIAFAVIAHMRYKIVSNGPPRKLLMKIIFVICIFLCTALPSVIIYASRMGCDFLYMNEGIFYQCKRHLLIIRIPKFIFFTLSIWIYIALQIHWTRAILKKIRRDSKRDPENFDEDSDARIQRTQIALILFFINLVLTNLKYPIWMFCAIFGLDQYVAMEIALLIWEVGMILDPVIMYFSQRHLQDENVYPTRQRYRSNGSWNKVNAYPLVRAGTVSEWDQFGICLNGLINPYERSESFSMEESESERSETSRKIQNMEENIEITPLNINDVCINSHHIPEEELFE